jgi:hypothetical protein
MGLAHYFSKKGGKLTTILGGKPTFGSLFPAFPSITFLAEHLAVVGNGLPAQMPRCDMVGLHL